MAKVRALKACYCGAPTALRDADSEPFEYHGPQASYLELLDGDWEMSADPLAGADPATRAAIKGRLRPVSDDHVHVPAHDEADPLDHDGNGKKGGAKKPADPERAAVIKALKAAKIKFFAGASTEKLKTLLPA